MNETGTPPKDVGECEDTRHELSRAIDDLIREKDARIRELEKSVRLMKSMEDSCALLLTHQFAELRQAAPAVCKVYSVQNCHSCADTKCGDNLEGKKPFDRRKSGYPDGSALIMRERERQKTVEGWSAGHDDEHTCSELVHAAVSYALHYRETPDGGTGLIDGRHYWPESWDIKHWKPCVDRTLESYVRNLVKAGALIAAEIDRLQRRLAKRRAREESPRAQIHEHGNCEHSDYAEDGDPLCTVDRVAYGSAAGVRELEYLEECATCQSWKREEPLLCEACGQEVGDPPIWPCPMCGYLPEGFTL